MLFALRRSSSLEVSGSLSLKNSTSSFDRPSIYFLVQSAFPSFHSFAFPPIFSAGSVVIILGPCQLSPLPPPLLLAPVGETWRIQQPTSLHLMPHHMVPFVRHSHVPALLLPAQLAPPPPLQMSPPHFHQYRHQCRHWRHHTYSFCGHSSFVFVKGIK